MNPQEFSILGGTKGTNAQATWSITGIKPREVTGLMNNHQTPQATSPLAAWLCYLEHLHSQPIELGLERVKQVAERLDLLKPAPKIFTVAGTNGKGTTCCTLEAILLAAGLRVGVYSSPTFYVIPSGFEFRGKSYLRQNTATLLLRSKLGEVISH